MKIKYLSAALMCTATIASYADNDVLGITDSTNNVTLTLTATAGIPDNAIEFCNHIVYDNASNAAALNFEDSADDDSTEIYIGGDATGMNNNNGKSIVMTVHDNITEDHDDSNGDATFVTKIGLNGFHDDDNSLKGHPVFEALYLANKTSYNSPAASSTTVDASWFTVDASGSASGVYTLGDIRMGGLYEVKLKAADGSFLQIPDGQVVKVYDSGDFATEVMNTSSAAIALEELDDGGCSGFNSDSGQNPIQIDFNSDAHAFITAMVGNTMDDDETVTLANVVLAQIGSKIGMFSENIDASSPPIATFSTTVALQFEEE